MKKIFSLFLFTFFLSFFILAEVGEVRAQQLCSVVAYNPLVTPQQACGALGRRVGTASDCNSTGLAPNYACCCPTFSGSTTEQTQDPGGGTTKTSADTKLDNPLGNIESPQALVGQVINSLFGIIGSLALVMFIYGGFLWMTSAGSSEQVKKGKDIFIWAVVGLMIVFSAYSIVRFVIEGIGA